MNRFRFGRLVSRWRVVALLVGACWARCAEIESFATPEAAAAALVSAAATQDTAALSRLFGPEASSLVNPDPVQSRQEMEAFSKAYAETHRWEEPSADRRVLLLGTEGNPFPVPLIRSNEGWRFDYEAGKEELLNRRIGRNELATLAAVRTYVDAQREYALRDRDGDDVLEFAQRITSSPGTMDGLYWPVEESGDLSPLGPLFATAQAEGYRPDPAGTGAARPFHGYLYKILTRQGAHAPGGRYNYVINGNMIGGFALVAYPAVYGETGIMTFIVNQQGRVYQKDLGPRTVRKAKSMREYDPDSSWELSPD